MKIFTEIISSATAFLGGFTGYFLGGFDGFLYALIIFIIIDYITGVMVAVLNKELSSEVGFKGIFKKVLTFCLVAIAQIIDSQIIGDGSVLRTAVIFFYLSNEGVSILENVAIIGLPVPEKLQSVLQQLTQEKKDEE